MNTKSQKKQTEIRCLISAILIALALIATVFGIANNAKMQTALEHERAARNTSESMKLLLNQQAMYIEAYIATGNNELLNKYNSDIMANYEKTIKNESKKLHMTSNEESIFKNLVDTQNKISSIDDQIITLVKDGKKNKPKIFYLRANTLK